MNGENALKAILLRALYIAVPLHLCLYILMKYSVIYFPRLYILVLSHIGRVYLPSRLLLMLQSGNPHYSDPVLEMIVPFLQTFIMVFIAVYLVHKVRGRRSSGGGDTVQGPV